ncbi:MAG: cysteine/glutathione ABC transporter permease/ATP-binding protein CydD [Candidatus Symbiodolus clandestinus]
MSPLQQRESLSWLRQQGAVARHWFTLTQGLGIALALTIAAQGWLLAQLLQQAVTEKASWSDLKPTAATFFMVVVLRSILNLSREQLQGWAASQIRTAIRKQLFDHLEQLGPLGRSASIGSWSSRLIEQVEQLQDYYARYLPQRTLVMLVPLTVVGVLAPINWVAAALLVITAPLIPLFMILAGQQAAAANRRSLQALNRLSSHFLDRLRGLLTLRLYGQAWTTQQEIAQVSNRLRQKTMAVLRLAFVSSAILEFFTALSIALAAVYFGFTYLGYLRFSAFPIEVTLFAGLLALLLAPEFYQPLRDLGSFYHAKAQALAAAEALRMALITPVTQIIQQGESRSFKQETISIYARDLLILSPQGIPLVGPLNFEVAAGSQIVLVGASGSGKSSLLHGLLGFLPYQGSCTLNGVELREWDRSSWLQQLAWVGQTPQLLTGSVLDNIRLRDPTADEESVARAVQQAAVDQFLPLLPQGLLTSLSNNGCELSVGQAQRIAVARALLRPCNLLLLDEPTASLDRESEQRVLAALHQASCQQTTLTVTHRLGTLQATDQIWVLESGKIVQQGLWGELQAQSDRLVGKRSFQAGKMDFDSHHQSDSAN